VTSLRAMPNGDKPHVIYCARENIQREIAVSAEQWGGRRCPEALRAGSASIQAGRRRPDL